MSCGESTAGFINKKLLRMMGNENIIEGMAVKNVRSPKVRKVCKIRKWRVLLVLTGIFVVLMIGLAGIVALGFGAGLLLSADSDTARKIAEIPIVDRVLPAKTRAEIAFSNYDAIFSDTSAYEEYQNLPREYSVEVSQSVDGYPIVGSYEITVSINGRSNAEGANDEVEASVDLGGFSADAKFTTAYDKKNDKSYLRVDSAPEAIFRVLAETLSEWGDARADVAIASEKYRAGIVGVWYTFSTGDLVSVASLSGAFGFDSAEAESVMADTDKVNLFLAKNIRGTEYEYLSVDRIKGVESYMFSAKLDEGAISSGVNRLVSDILGKLGFDDNYLAEAFSVEDAECFVWLDKNGHVTKESFSAVLVFETGDGAGEFVSELSFVSESWDFGIEQEVSMPKGAKSLIQLIKLFAPDVLGIKDERLPRFPVD